MEHFSGTWFYLAKITGYTTRVSLQGPHSVEVSEFFASPQERYYRFYDHDSKKIVIILNHDDISVVKNVNLDGIRLPDFRRDNTNDPIDYQPPDSEKLGKESKIKNILFQYQINED